MKRYLLLAAAGMGACLYASTFELYRDGSVYTYHPKETFIGFAPKGTKAECGDRTLSVVSSAECPQQNRLCREKESIRRWSLDAALADRKMRYIDALMNRAEVKISDPEQILTMSEKAARSYAEARKRKERADKEAKWRKEAFLKKAPVLEPLHFDSLCDKEVKLTIPGRYITFEMLYEADIGDDAQVEVSQHIQLRNRSGIDIAADRAMLYYQPMYRYLRPIRFTPWIVRERPEAKVRAMQKMAMPVAAEAVADTAYENVTVEKARNYRIGNLVLPSNGERVDIAVQSWRSASTRGERVYPYRDTRVYRVVRFQPKTAIETDRWRIRSGGKLLASNVRGEYMDGEYTLFVGVDEDLIVTKEPMILKEKESFFGHTVRKKDGYTVRLVNQSGEKRRLTIVERIPVATRSDVEVKLLSVTSDTAMKYRPKKWGELQIDVTIPARKSAEVSVLFEVSYDKEKPVVY